VQGKNSNKRVALAVVSVPGVVAAAEAAMVLVVVLILIVVVAVIVVVVLAVGKVVTKNPSNLHGKVIYI
jgi:type III secretory pathway component EscU